MGKQKLTHMKRLMNCVEKAARTVNLPHLVKQNMTERDSITLYNSVKHLFMFPAKAQKKRQYETMSWKSYYNLLCKRKWRLYGEQEEEQQAQEPTTVTTVREIVLMGGGNQQTGRKRRKRAIPRTRKKKRIEVIKVNNEFATAFASVPAAESEAEAAVVEPVAEMMTGCSLGAQCKNKHLTGFMTCHWNGCSCCIHHLCAISHNFTDKENELHVYCSRQCM